MRVVVISDSIQEFDGLRYWLCGHYFQRRGKRLHRMVWEHHNGPIPKGSHTHHRDGDIRNNQVENLELRSASSHMSLHGKQSDHTAWAKSCHIGAAKWHGSEDGRKWHAEHYEKHCRGVLHAKSEKTCEYCQEKFMGQHNSRFCSRKCQQRDWQRRNRKQGHCQICGCEFTGIGKTCSPGCSMRLAWDTRKGRQG